MRVCIVCGQIAGFGRIGGFGTMARRLVEGLDAHGVEVSVLVLRTADLKARQNIGKIPVIAPPPSAFFFGSSIFADDDIQADIFHSQEPTLGTYRMQLQAPSAKHIVTCIDPRDDSDWSEEYRRFSLKKKLLYPAIRGFEDSKKVRNAVKNADRVICQTKFIKPKCKKIYGLNEDPDFLGNPIDFPQEPPNKADKPTVLFLARLDKRKRPELFFELARKNPSVDFVCIGKAHDAAWDKELHDRYADLPNVEMLGYIDPFTSNKIDEILQKSWILINTASREGLPSAFVEAISHRCAILSTVNPDGFAESFGYFAKSGDELNEGLSFLLENDRWKEYGEKGYQYGLDNFETDKVITQHIELYERMLS